MKCDYCETTEDVHTLSDRELGPDLHICRRCWERGEDARLRQYLTLKPVETPYLNKMPRKTWDTPVYQFNPIAVGGNEIMTEQSNICEICGGIKKLVYFVEAVPKNTALTISADSVPPSKPWGHLCYGHPKGAPKHDGKLEGEHEFHVAITNDVYSPAKCGWIAGMRIRGTTPDWEDVTIEMTAKQAISLLSWLEQNRAELTALAEEMDK